MNLFSITGQETEEKVVKSIPQFVKTESDVYEVVVRFRNKKDYDDFVTLIGQPKLKALTKVKMHRIKFPALSEEVSLETLLGD